MYLKKYIISILLIKAVKVLCLPWFYRSVVLPPIYLDRLFLLSMPSSRTRPSPLHERSNRACPLPTSHQPPPHLHRLLHGLPVETLALIPILMASSDDRTRCGGGIPTLHPAHRAPTRLPGRKSTPAICSSFSCSFVTPPAGSLGLRFRVV